MTEKLTLEPIVGPSAWRGDDLAKSDEWIYRLSRKEIAELEDAGRRFVEDDPDMRTVTADHYPLPHCEAGLRSWGHDLDRGRGFVLVRGLPTPDYPDALSGAIFYLLGLHLGQPMQQYQSGEVLGHVKARGDMEPEKLVSSQSTRELQFHSDSSDVVALMCLRSAPSGGASRLASSATLYNEVLARRPDLAPALFEPLHWDWAKQDHDAPQNTYTSPMCSIVDGTFSMYAGSSIVFSAQAYPEVPPLTPEQVEVLRLVDAVSYEPGVALDMNFQPGDIQWLLNYAALHSRTEYVDEEEPSRRRHLLRLWLKREVGRPLVPRFGKHVVKSRATAELVAAGDPAQTYSIGGAVVPRWEVTV